MKYKDKNRKKSPKAKNTLEFYLINAEPHCRNGTVTFESKDNWTYSDLVSSLGKGWAGNQTAWPFCLQGCLNRDHVWFNLFIIDFDLYEIRSKRNIYVLTNKLFPYKTVENPWQPWLRVETRPARATVLKYSIIFPGRFYTIPTFGIGVGSFVIQVYSFLRKTNSRAVSATTEKQWPVNLTLVECFFFFFSPLSIQLSPKFFSNEQPPVHSIFTHGYQI